MSTQTQITEPENTAPENSERQLQDTALEERRSFLQSLSDSSFEAVLIANDEGRYIDVNSAACDLLGYTQDELMQLSVSDISAEPFRQNGLVMWEEFIAAGSASGEYSVRRKDGTILQLEFRALTNILPGFHVSFIRDLKERSRAEEKKIAEENLRQSQSLMAEAQHLAQLGSWTRNLITNEVAWSDELFRLYGLDPQQEGANYAAFLAQVHPDDRIRAQAIAQEAIRTLEPRAFEYRIVRTDGVERILRERISVTANDQGQAIRIFGTTQDITERRKSEKALRESEERYRELFENAKDGCYLHDLNGRYTAVNRAAEKLTGYSREEILGRTFAGFVPPEQISFINEHFCKKLAQEGETSYETEVITREGRRVAVEVSSHLIYEEESGVAVQGTIRDITERKRAEERLRKYEKVVERLEEMIVVVDRDYRCLIANRAFLNHRGWGREDVVGQRLPDLLPAEQFDAIRKRLDACFEGNVIKFETTYAEPGKGERTLSISYFPIEGAAGINRVASVVQDITDRKAAENALRNYSRLLIEAQEAERQRIARELHDQIGQMLTAVKMNLHAIGSSQDRDESSLLIEQGLELVDTALEQARSLSFELRPSLLQNLGLEAALRSYCNEFTQRTGILTRSETKLPEGTTRLKSELETACFRITQEALTNVSRHASATHVSIDLSASREEMVLSIKDDGVGFIPPVPSAGAEATSLGLMGMKERALALDGTLEIKSAPGHGTEIRVCFSTGDRETPLPPT